MRRTQFTGRQGLVAALEAEEVIAAAADAADPIGGNAESLETDLIEVAELSAEGDDDQADTDEATEVATALESIAEALGISAANGGMDKHSAYAVGVAVDHLYSRVGIARKSMPAMETFALSVSSRTSSTQIAMEDIKEQAKKIWEAILAQLAKAIEWAIAFFNSVFDAGTKLQARAKALVAKAEALTGEAKEKSFENERLVKALHVAGTTTGVAAGIDTINELAKKIFGDTHFYTEALGEGILADMATPDLGKTYISKFSMAAFSEAALKEVTNPESIGMAAAPEGLAVFRGAELPGGMAMVARAPKTAMEGQAAIDAITGISTTVAPFDGKATAPAKNDIGTLTGAQAVSIAKGVEALAGELLGYKAQQAKLTELKKKISAGAAALSKKTDVAEDEAAGIKAAQRVAGTIPKWIDSPAKEFARYSVNTGKAMLDYVEESLKQYGSKAPAAV